ncbi:MAG TPA: acetate uptake transporter [Gammaproteobacteria bacterium]|nr:acetate uptake transporter [Gammaproteobacteria bacterium]
MPSDTQTPAGNPAPLGLIGFGLTTVVLSLINAGILPHEGESVVIPLALAFGGLIQMIAGILEFKTGNTFGMTAFLSYGAFWWWFALMLLFNNTGAINLKGAETTIATTLIAWGVFTMYMWVSTFRLNRALWLVFLTLWITFYLLGLGMLTGAAWLSHLGGWVGLLCGLLAVYTSFALVTNATAGKTVMPVGPFSA